MSTNDAQNLDFDSNSLENYKIQGLESMKNIFEFPEDDEIICIVSHPGFKSHRCVLEEFKFNGLDVEREYSQAVSECMFGYYEHGVHILREIEQFKELIKYGYSTILTIPVESQLESNGNFKVSSGMKNIADYILRHTKGADNFYVLPTSCGNKNDCFTGYLWNDIYFEGKHAIKDRFTAVIRDKVTILTGSNIGECLAVTGAYAAQESAVLLYYSMNCGTSRLNLNLETLANPISFSQCESFDENYVEQITARILNDSCIDRIDLEKYRHTLREAGRSMQIARDNPNMKINRQLKYLVDWD